MAGGSRDDQRSGPARTDADGELEASERHRYFRAIEERFLRLRGAPMMLSPADWRIALGWSELGVPLPVVEGVLDRVFEQRRERGAKGRVQGLRYFDDAVRAAWAEVAELRGPAPAAPSPGIDPDRRLGELAAALPAELPERDRWVRAVRSCAAAGGGETGLQGIEEALREVERDLAAAARGWLEPAQLAEERAAVAPALTALRDRLPADAVERTAERLLDRQLRDRFGLPELSLFAARPRA